MSDLGPEARAVLDAGRGGDEPTPADRARIRAAVVSALAAGGAGAAATVAGEGAAVAGMAKGATVLGGVGWGILAGLAVIGALGAREVLVRSPSAAPAASAPSAFTPIAVAPPIAPAVAPSVDPGPPLAPSSRPVVRAAASALPRASVEPVAPEPAPPPPVDSLAAETRGLGDAHGALKDGDPALALRLLDQQSSMYADGQLREERAAARILALCKLGRLDEARALSDRFLAESPRSPLADRVRSACAGR